MFNRGRERTHKEFRWGNLLEDTLLEDQRNRKLLVKRMLRKETLVMCDAAGCRTTRWQPHGIFI